MHSYIFPNFQGHGGIQQVNDKQQCSKNIDDLQKIAINIVTYKPFVGLHPYIERRFIAAIIIENKNSYEVVR